MKLNNPAAAAAVVYARLLLVGFRWSPGFGTCANADNINDNNVGNTAQFNVVDEYAQMELPGGSDITQFRHYGNVGNNNDGFWKVQYRNAAGAWVDWVTGIATRGATWSGWDSTGGTVTTSAIRFVCTTVDTGSGGESRVAELEVIY